MQQGMPTHITREHLFAFGFGYSAQTLADRLTKQNWICSGTVRSAEKAAALRARYGAVGVFDGVVGPPVQAGAHWLISVPPDEEGCPVYRAYQGQAHSAATLTYLSTTGIYGDLQGGWAFEWTPPNPGSERGKARALAERQWQGTGRPFRTVRLPGIYGPGRSPFARIRAGTAQRIIKPGQVFSRVHIDDIASGLEAMLERPQATGVFHLCDDAPAPPQDVTAYAAALLGEPAPEAVPFESADLSPMARSFYSECKRVSNARAKSALGWFPTYKTYETGLKQILDAERDIPG